MNKYYNSIAPKKISLKLIFCIFAIFAVTMPLYSQGNPVLKSDLEYRRDAVSNVRGTFNSVPRLENGRADLETLIEQLVDLNVNTYFWCFFGLLFFGKNKVSNLLILLDNAYYTTYNMLK